MDEELVVKRGESKGKMAYRGESYMNKTDKRKMKGKGETASGRKSDLMEETMKGGNKKR